MEPSHHTVPVTVVIPAFNRERYVAQAVASAVGQRGSCPERVLVIDDASTDRTAEVARSAGAEVITVSQNGGGAQARARGIAEASTQWIALLDSDDYWTPGHLDQLWNARGSHAILSSGSLACTSDGAAVSYMGPKTGRPLVLHSPAELYPTNFISTSGVMFDREIALRVGGFRTDLRWAEDLDLWLRILEQSTGLVLPDPTVRYRLHEGQKVNDPGARSAQRALLLAYSERPWWTPAVYHRHMAVRAWDAMRAHIRERNWGQAAVEGRWFLRSPARMNALVAVLSDRKERRQVGAGFLTGTSA